MKNQKRILFVAKVDSHIRHFQSKYFSEFQDRGYSVDVMAEGNEVFPLSCKKFNIKFGINPFSKQVINSFNYVRKILREEKYDIIQCNTAIASVVVRLATMLNKSNERIVYMAHGFHFYKGGPIIDWLLYYPIEKFFGRNTDLLITINEEDFELSNRKRIGKKRMLINGIGFEPLTSFPKTPQKMDFRGQTINFSFIGEINKNKNQSLIVDVMKELRNRGYLVDCKFVGDGNLLDWWRKEIKINGMEDYIHFEGYASDIQKYLIATDIYLSSSLREGLGLNILEALSCGLPVVCTPNRGHKEIINEGVNGYFAKDVKTFADRIVDLVSNPELYKKISENSIASIQKFTIDNIKNVYVESVIGE